MLIAAPAHAQPPLAAGELEILGAQLVVSPVAQAVPKNQATGLTAQLADAANLAAALPIARLGSLVVKGTLTGVGIDTPRALSVALSNQPSAASATRPIRPLVGSVNSARAGGCLSAVEETC